jgi:arylsulfatase A-like enzyme
MPGQEKSLICEQVISSLDLLPTFLAQANAEIPSDLDGIDLSPFLEAEENKTFHRTLYWRENTFVGPSRFMRSGNEKYVSADKNIEDEFYHLHSDISESNNLSSAYPERLTDLKKKYKAWSLSMPKPRW